LLLRPCIEPLVLSITAADLPFNLESSIFDLQLRGGPEVFLELALRIQTLVRQRLDEMCVVAV